MEATMNNHISAHPPILKTTSDYTDSASDQANIRAGRKTQRAIANRHSWQAYLSPNAYKRTRLSYMVPPNDEYAGPAYAEQDSEIPRHRSKRFIPLLAVLRLSSKHEDTIFDPDTIPVLTKRQMRKAEKKERKRLDELAAYQRKEFNDRISRQMEVQERERHHQQPQPPCKRSVREKVKNTLRKTRHLSGTKEQCVTCTTPPAEPLASRPPHIDDFQNKNDLRSWFGPSDVEALPAPTTIPDLPPAELPGNSIEPTVSCFGSDIAKRPYEDIYDGETLHPPPPRSPSPCLFIPRRGITVNDTLMSHQHKQMQCDYCHSAIKMTGYHYACTTCDGGDRLYCNTCVDDGRTCRHELIEKTRNIKRHPTNPQQSQERRALPTGKDATLEPRVDLSVPHMLNGIGLPQTTISRSSTPEARLLVSKTSATQPDTCEHTSSKYMDFEAKRREHEVTFREKEVTLREREAMLREREVWTAARERDAALVQQLHAAAMFQQRERSAEVGAQFSSCSPVSRQSSHCQTVSDFSSCGLPSHSTSTSRTYQRKNSDTSSGLLSLHQQFTGPRDSESLTLHSSTKGKNPNFELATSVAALEASFAGTEISESAIRSHTNNTQRKASTANGKVQGTGSTSRKRSGNRSQTYPKKSDEHRGRGDDDDDEDERAGSPKRQKQDGTEAPQKLFACPFHKYDSIRYSERNNTEMQYRGCASGVLRDISRVKQHLKRNHHRPEHYCRRCFSEFSSVEELQDHSSQKQGCDVRDCPWHERLDETKQSKIHVKRPGMDPGALWMEIFSIIFPYADRPESPYIETITPCREEPDVLDHFIRAFNRRLDLAGGSSDHPWLKSHDVRALLKSELVKAKQEMMQHGLSPGSSSASRVPSVLVSPVSPAPHQFMESRHSSQSSRNSPRVPSLPGPLLSPVSAASGPRPILKVNTYQTPSTSATNSRTTSSGDQQRAMFPTIPTHIVEDQGYDHLSDSWRSGDDVPMMTEIALEPSSATSTRSTKSVSFATPPRQLEQQDSHMHYDTVDLSSFTESNTRAPTLFDFTNFDWSTQNFGLASDVSSQQNYFKPSNMSRTDSAYGTLSSRHDSKSSIRPPREQQVHQVNTAFGGQGSQMNYVDPQMLFVNPAQVHMDMNSSGPSPDFQTFNGTNDGHFGY